MGLGEKVTYLVWQIKKENPPYYFKLTLAFHSTLQSDKIWLFIGRSSKIRLQKEIFDKWDGRDFNRV